jgi:thioredoxin
VEINEEEFNKKITEGDRFVADFFAVWCPPCKKFAPVFSGAERKAGKIVAGAKSPTESPCDFVKIDVDKCPEISEEYGVRSVPTIILFDKGVAVDTHIGTFGTENELLKFVGIV